MRGIVGASAGVHTAALGLLMLAGCAMFGPPDPVATETAIQAAVAATATAVANRAATDAVEEARLTFGPRPTPSRFAPNPVARPVSARDDPLLEQYWRSLHRIRTARGAMAEHNTPTPTYTLFEIVAGQAMRMVISPPQGEVVEFRAFADRVYVTRRGRWAEVDRRSPNGQRLMTWIQSGSLMPEPIGDLDAFPVYRRLGYGTVRGVNCVVYEASWEGAPARRWLSATDGLLRRVEVELDSATVIVDYIDYDVPISVERPRLGAPAAPSDGL